LTLLSAFVAWCGSAPAQAGDKLAAPARSALALDAEAPAALRPPGAASDDGGPSPVVFPEQRLPLRFNHQKHVKQLGVGCTTCHAGAKTSQKSADSLLPPATRCDGCHGTNHRRLSAVTTDEPRALGQCGFCHAGYDIEKPNIVARVLLPKPNLRFNHQKHVAGQRMPCCALPRRGRGALAGDARPATAHEAVHQLSRARLPPAAASSKAPLAAKSVAGANAIVKASGACTTCHLSEPNGMLTTTLPAARCCRPPGCTTPGTTPTSSSATSSWPATTVNSAPTVTRSGSALVATTATSSHGAFIRTIF
jgi:hypothetical protein